MKHFAFILITLITLSNIAVQAASRTIITRSPYYYNPYFNQNTYDINRQNIRPSFNDMSMLEEYALNRNYGRDSNIARLERLEMQAFGAVQCGDLNSRYENVRSAILSRPKPNYKTSILRGIGNYFAGQMTGYTPNIGTSNPFDYFNTFSQNPYPTTYGNSSITEYSGPYGRGYRVNNYNTGSTTGVRILD